MIFAITLEGSEELVGVLELEVNATHKRGGLGYWLGREYRGKGIMREAVSILIDHTFRELDLIKISTGVFSKNQPSIKLLERLGFSCEGMLRKHIVRDGQPVDVFAYGLLRVALLRSLRTSPRPRKEKRGGSLGYFFLIFFSGEKTWTSRAVL